MFDELRALLDGVPVMQGIAAATGLSIASLIAGVLGKIFGGGDTSAFAPTTAEQRALQQSMVELIEQQRGYMSEQDPLRASVNRMAMGMMPIRYQTGQDYRSGSGDPSDILKKLAAKTYNRTGAGWRDRKEEAYGAPPRGSLVGKRIDSQAYRDLVDDYFGGPPEYQRPLPGE